MKTGRIIISVSGSSNVWYRKIFDFLLSFFTIKYNSILSKVEHGIYAYAQYMVISDTYTCIEHRQK